MTDSNEDTQQAVKTEVNGKGDDFYEFLSKISSVDLPDPSFCGFAFNPMTMEYEQPCGYGPNGEPEFFDDDND